MTNGQAVPPMVMAPGQHVIKREDAGAEVRTPWQQTLRGVLCNVIIYATLTACALIIGKSSLIIGGAIATVVLTWLAWRWTQSTVGVGIIIVISLSILFVAGPALAEMAWPERWTIDHWLVKLWAVSGLVLTLVMPFLNGSFRYLSEVADPNGPTAPRSAVAWPGVVWPWQAREVFEELNYPEEPSPVAPRDPMIIRDRGKPIAPVLPEAALPADIIEMTPEQRQSANLEEFLVRGATEQRNGGTRGFARDNWMGFVFATGDPMTDPLWRQFTGWLKTGGWMESSRAGTFLTASLAEVLAGLETPQTRRDRSCG